jgi:hypothetical protein
MSGQPLAPTMFRVVILYFPQEFLGGGNRVMIAIRNDAIPGFNEPNAGPRADRLLTTVEP